MSPTDGSRPLFHPRGNKKQNVPFPPKRSADRGPLPCSRCSHSSATSPVPLCASEGPQVIVVFVLRLHDCTLSGMACMCVTSLLTAVHTFRLVLPLYSRNTSGLCIQSVLGIAGYSLNMVSPDPTGLPRAHRYTAFQPASDFPRPPCLHCHLCPHSV